MKQYEIFTENYSVNVYANSIIGALIKFKNEFGNSEILCIEKEGFNKIANPEPTLADLDHRDITGYPVIEKGR